MFTVHGGYATQTMTKIHTVTNNALTESFNLHSTAGVGEWGLCYKTSGSDDWMEVGWHGYKLTVVERPGFSPGVGIAASYNKFIMTTSAVPGDYVVVQPGNCDDAQLANSSESRIGPTQLVHDSQNRSHFVSPISFTTPGDYVLCHATKESGGDDESDYTQLALPFKLRQRVTFSPNRTVSGAAQYIDLQLGEYNDAVSWTTMPDCDNILGDAKPYKSWIYTLDGTAEYQVQFVSNANPGVWSMCFLAAGGAWTKVTGRDLIVIPLPTFFPEIGVAGSVTPITFTRGAGEPLDERGDLVDGDVLVLQESHCLQA